MYIVEVYEERNVTHEAYQADDAQTARRVAVKLSRTNEHGTVVKTGTYPSISFERYEDGEMTEWSYPRGLDS